MKKNVDDEWASLKNGETIDRYFRKGDKIYVEENPYSNKELKGVDLTTFQVSKVGDIAIDRKQAWFQSYKIKVDLATLEVLSRSFHKDKSKVYCGTSTLPGADPQT